MDKKELLMSSTRDVLGLCGVVVVGTVAGAGICAAAGAVAGATGAAIMNSAGHAGYIGSELAKMGAIGGAILGAPAGICKMVNDNKESKTNKSCLQGIAKYSAGILVGNWIGYGILLKAGAATMTFANVSIGATAALAVKSIRSSQTQHQERFFTPTQQPLGENPTGSATADHVVSIQPN
jgi:hypothetical protein